MLAAPTMLMNKFRNNDNECGEQAVQREGCVSSTMDHSCCTDVGLKFCHISMFDLRTTLLYTQSAFTLVST